MSFGHYQQLRKLFLSLLAFLVLIAAALAYLSHSTSGTRWLIGHLGAALPGELHTKGINGSLWQGVTVRQLGYRDKAWQLSMEDLRFQVDWPKLLTGRLAINEVTVRSLHYQRTEPPDDAGNPLKLSFLGLPFVVSIKKAEISELTLTSAEQETRLRQAQLRRARLRGHKLTVTEIGVSTQGVALTVTELTVSLRGKIPLTARIHWQYAKSNLSGQGSIDGTLARLTFNHVLEQPAAVSAQGSVELLNRVEPHFQATLRWPRWQVADYLLQQGHIKVAGTLNDYQLSVSTQLAIRDNAAVVVKGSARGNRSGLADAKLEARSPKGLLHLSGPLSWAPELSADMVLKLSDFDPSLWFPDLQGQVTGTALLRVRGTAKASVQDIELTGHLRGGELRGNGELFWSPGHWRCSACLLAIGNNQMSADGTIDGQQLALKFVLKAPELQQLWSQLDGQLEASGQLQGSVILPRFSGMLQARQLRYGSWSADSLALNSDTQADGKAQIEAAVTAVRRGKVLLGSGSIDAQGALDNLRFDLDWQRQEAKFSSQGSLQWRQDKLSGSIGRGMLVEPHGGGWRLRNPVKFEYRDSTVAISPHTWVGQDSGISIAQFSYGRETTLSGQLRRLPLSTLNALLPAHYELTGAIDAAVDLERREDNWKGTITLEQQGALLRIAEPSLEPTEISMPLFNVRVTLAQGVADVAASACVEPGMEAQLTGKVSQLGGTTGIDGQLHLRGDQWAWLPVIIPAVDDVTGDVSATMTFKGPLLRPDLNGAISLRNGRLAVPAMNITLEQIDLTLQGQPDSRVLVSGSATTGGGSLALNGQIDDLLRATRSLALTLTGDSALVANWPEYRLWASPELRIAGGGTGWRAEGSVTVPRAEIAPRDVPESAVTPSDDVQVLGRSETTKPRLNLSGQVHLLAGDRVRLKAQGLETRLSGELLVSMNHSTMPTVQGQLTLKDGVFKAFGQSLSVRKGSLGFTGPPDNPLIDVVAVRGIAEPSRTITAGIHIVGYAEALTTTVFSEPSLGQTDALSYLVVGRPLSGLSESQGGDLASAALSLSISQAAPIAQELSQKFGVDQLSVSGGGNEMALVLGKNLGRRWYARYAYGVFSQIGTLFLGYRLGENLLLEAGTGEHQAIDLLYTLEQP